MPLSTPSPAATSAAAPSTEIVSRSNSGPATAATSSSSRRGGVEPAQPLADHLSHALRAGQLVDRPHRLEPPAGRLDGAGLDQHPPQLGDQERVALGEIADRGGHRDQLVVALAARGPQHELGRVPRIQPGDPQPGDGVRAPQVGQQVAQRRAVRGVRLAVGGDQQQACVAGRADEVADQRERRLVRPVEILQHEQHAVAAAGVGRAGRRRRRAAGGAPCPRPPAPARAARRPPIRRSGTRRASSPPTRPMSARSSSGGVARTSCSSASTTGWYGDPTTLSQSP